MKALVAITGFIVSIILGAASFYWRIPTLFPYRSLLFMAIIFCASGIIALGSWRLLARPGQSPITRGFLSMSILVSAFALLFTMGSEINFRLVKYKVMRSDPSDLRKLGRHIIVGYQDEELLKRLIKKGAIGGVFVTARNVEGKTALEVRRMIQSFQEINFKENRYPLWIATDQEGGVVSRMSPPLPRRESLSMVIADHPDDLELEEVVSAYANEQSRGLALLGVNLNLAPVVDLNHEIINPEDKYTKIYKRAISDDHRVVSKTARIYCQELAAQGIICSMKHFPGLGRVYNDTHSTTATIESGLEELERSDLAPFRRLMKQGAACVMLSHVVMMSIDPENPVSASFKVINGLIRKRYDYQGLLITDNLTMTGFFEAAGGIGEGALKALNAGVDLLLISYDPDQYFYVMAALLKAEKQGEISRVRLEKSVERLNRSIKGLVNKYSGRCRS